MDTYIHTEGKGLMGGEQDGDQQDTSCHPSWEVLDRELASPGTRLFVLGTRCTWMSDM